MPAESPEDQWPDITSADRVVWDRIPSGHDRNEEARRVAAEEQAREKQRRQAELERKKKEDEERWAHGHFSIQCCCIVHCEVFTR